VYVYLTAMAYARASQFQLLSKQLTVFKEIRYEGFASGIHHRMFVLIPCNPN
jgi:hypothetical protein